MIGVIFFSAVALFADTPPRIHLSNDTPKWGDVVTLTYTPPDTSVFSKNERHDTLFCFAELWKLNGKSGLVTPMHQREHGTYMASIRIPDSTTNVRFEICTPPAPAPGGVMLMPLSVRTRSGQSAPGGAFEHADNLDSALAADIALYPWHFAAFSARFDDALDPGNPEQPHPPDTAMLTLSKSLISQMLRRANHTPSWFLTLSQLYARSGNDSVANAMVRSASALTQMDLIYHDGDFWFRFFMQNGKRADSHPMQAERRRLIAPLVGKFPGTIMATEWLRRATNDSLLDGTVFRNVVATWKETHDVNILLAIADAYHYKNCPQYDPATSLFYLDKAETCSRTFAGFYSGESRWGSRNSLRFILVKKIGILSELHKLDDAHELARKSLSESSDSRDQQLLRAALGSAYLDAGKVDSAQKTFGKALSTSLTGTLPGLDRLYAVTKQDGETREAFRKRLIAMSTNDVDLPMIMDFRYTTIEGKNGSLAGLRGKVVVIDCWFINCPGCNAEKKSLNDLADAFAGDSNVVFLSIARDDASAVKKYLEKMASKFQVVTEGGDICDNIGVTGYPTHIIIGRNGKTLGWDLGGSERSGDQMKDKIKEALAAKGQ